MFKKGEKSRLEIKESECEVVRLEFERESIIYQKDMVVYLLENQIEE